MKGCWKQGYLSVYSSSITSNGFFPPPVSNAMPFLKERLAVQPTDEAHALSNTTAAKQRKITTSHSNPTEYYFFPLVCNGKHFSADLLAKKKIITILLSSASYCYISQQYLWFPQYTQLLTPAHDCWEYTIIISTQWKLLQFHFRRTEITVFL